MDDNGRNFARLNRAGVWLGSQWSGLELDGDGTLRLNALPAPASPLPETIAALPAPGGPAGIAVAPGGAIFYTDPDGGRIFQIDPCDGSAHPLRTAFALHTPRGLWFSRHRDALLVAEGGSGRVTLLRPPAIDAAGFLAPSTAFQSPWTLAEDAGGVTYVVDHGTQRVVRFNTLGDEDPSFWATLQAAAILTAPVDVAVGEAAIYIVDGAAKAVFVIDAYGNPLLGEDGKALHFGDAVLEAPLGIAVGGGKVFVGDNLRRQVLQFDVAGGYRFDGAAVDYAGPVAALAFSVGGTLLVHTGGSMAPVALLLATGYTTAGVLWSGAVPAPTPKPVWSRLQAACAPLPADTHMQFFVHIADDPLDAPVPPLAGAATPFADPRWQPMPIDATDLSLRDAPGRYLWMGAAFSGDGLGTPSLSQLTVFYNQRGYIEDLPAIYRKPGECGGFLKRLLQLYESLNLDTEETIRRLPALFDPEAAPGTYLPWLAGTLALVPEEDWSPATTRANIAAAYTRYAQTGTPAGLRDALREFANVEAVIAEPITTAHLWALPAPAQTPCANDAQTGAAGSVQWVETGCSVLGYTTMLASAQAQGAVLGSTAVLDQSHLLTEDEYGAPLFDDVAFRFAVLLYRGQLRDDATLELVERVLEEQSPAHTAYNLCIVEPQMRVGYQARVGIDTVVGGPAASFRLGDAAGLGANTALGGPPPARIDAASRVGVNTRLS